MLLTDLIAEAIFEALAETETAVIRRNELAALYGCAPSQITYVLSSRFSPEQGYIVESRRGGGGSIRITRVGATAGDIRMHVVNAIGDEIDENSTRAILENLRWQDFLSDEAKNLILAATSDKALGAAGTTMKNRLRASVLKQMLLTIRE